MRSNTFCWKGGQAAGRRRARRTSRRSLRCERWRCPRHCGGRGPPGQAQPALRAPSIARAAPARRAEVVRRAEEQDRERERHVERVEEVLKARVQRRTVHIARDAEQHNVAEGKSGDADLQVETPPAEQCVGRRAFRTDDRLVAERGKALGHASQRRDGGRYSMRTVRRSRSTSLRVTPSSNRQNCSSSQTQDAQWIAGIVRAARAVMPSLKEIRRSATAGSSSTAKRSGSSPSARFCETPGDPVARVKIPQAAPLQDGEDGLASGTTEGPVRRGNRAGVAPVTAVAAQDGRNGRRRLESGGHDGSKNRCASRVPLTFLLEIRP